MLENDLRLAIQFSNRHISLRQMGRETDVDHARISRFVRGLAPLTLAQADALAAKLGLRLLRDEDSISDWPRPGKMLEYYSKRAERRTRSTLVSLPLCKRTCP